MAIVARLIQLKLISPRQPRLDGNRGVFISSGNRSADPVHCGESANHSSAGDKTKAALRDNSLAELIIESHLKGSANTTQLDRCLHCGNQSRPVS